MHFLEPAQFINAPDLLGHKVNVLYNPGLAERPPPTSAVYIPVGVWALKQPLCSHLQKITNETVFVQLFGGQMATRCACCHFRPPKSLNFQGPPLPIARVKSLPRIKIIAAHAI